MKNRALLILMTIIIMLLILAGGAYPWATWIAAAALCITYLIDLVKKKKTDNMETSGRYRLIELCMLASLLFLMIVLQPLPTALTRLTGAERFKQNSIAAQTMIKAEDVLQSSSFSRYPSFAMTRNRAGTMRNTILLIAIFAALLTTTRLSGKQRKIFLSFLCLIGGTLAIAGYISLKIKPQGDTIWWIYKIPHNLPGPILCFVNRNHFAGYLAMLSPPALALFFYNIKNKRIFSALINLSLFAITTIVMALTLSRGAVIAYCAGLSVLLIIYLATKKWIASTTMIILGIALSAAVLFIAGPQFKQRMSALRAPLEKGNFDERLDEWKTCSSIWKTYPIFGAGPDAFRMVYPQHRTTSRREYTTHAENEYLQLFSDSGIIGLLIFLGLIISILIYIRRTRSTYNKDYMDIIFPAAGSAITVTATHACFDFAPHLPLYGITAAIFIGLMINSPDHTLPHKTNRQYSWPIIFAIIILFSLSWHLKSMRKFDAPRKMLKLDKETLAKTIIWAPSSWQAWCYFGLALNNPDNKQATQLGEKCVTRATELDPNNYLLWLELGKLRQQLNMIPEARVAYSKAKELRFWVNVPDLPKSKN